MNCKDFESMVHEIVSGRVSDKTKQLEALEHAGHCLWCALRFDEETKLTESLQAFAKAHQVQRAPARVEEALVQAFRERTREASVPLFRLSRKRLWRWLSWGTVFVATVAAAWVVILGIRRPGALVLHHGQPKSAALATPRGLAEKAPLAEWASAATTDFIPLGTCDGSECMDDAVLVHVTLPAEALLSFGLPINNDEMAAESVEADVVIGSDGIPSAIRFVN
jgi:hypothetical protein